MGVVRRTSWQSGIAALCCLFSAAAIFSVCLLLRDVKMTARYTLTGVQVGCQSFQLRRDVGFGGIGVGGVLVGSDTSTACYKERDLCGFHASEIERILSLPHGKKSREKRFWLDGQWRNLRSAWKIIDKKRAKYVCMIMSVQEEVPCLRKDECLLPLYVRPNASDLNVVRQLFEHQEYSFVADFHPKTILDAGGNVGMASVIFATLFPDAKIISLEPSMKNYETLLLNVKGLQNVIPLRAALWKSIRQLKLVNCTTGHKWHKEWGFQVEEVEKWGEVEEEFIMTGLTIELLLKLFNLKKFDFTKIDIEGSEKELFTRSETNSLKWMNNTALFMVEVHNSMRAGAQAAVDGIFRAGDGKFKLLKDYGMFQAWTNAALSDPKMRENNIL